MAKIEKSDAGKCSRCYQIKQNTYLVSHLVMHGGKEVCDYQQRICKSCIIELGWLKPRGSYSAPKTTSSITPSSIMKAPFVVKALSVLLQKLEMQDDEFNKKRSIQDRLDVLKGYLELGATTYAGFHVPFGFAQAQPYFHNALLELIELIAFMDAQCSEQAEELRRLSVEMPKKCEFCGKTTESYVGVCMEVDSNEEYAESCWECVPLVADQDGNITETGREKLTEMAQCRNR